SQPGEPGMAAAEPDDAPEPAPSPVLRRGVSVRPSRGRPTPEAGRTAGDGPATPPAGGGPGPDTRPTTGLHHPGAVPRQPGPAGGQPGEERPTGRAGAGAVAPGRAAAVRALRPTDARPVFGGEGPGGLPLHARIGRLRRTALPGPLRAGARRL